MVSLNPFSHSVICANYKLNRIIINKMEHTKPPPTVEQAHTWVCKDTEESQHHQQTAEVQPFDTTQKMLFLSLLSL